VLQMFSHGVIAGLLFAVVGRMVYERTHTRELDVLETMRLGKVMPFAAVIFVLAGAASMGLPGFSGFVAEFQVLIGAWQRYPTLTVIAGLGVLVGVAYTLRAMQKAFFGEATRHPAEGHAHVDDDPISVPERLGAVLLLGVSIAIGLFPRLLLDIIVPSFNSPLFHWLPKGGQ
jgi:NADH-quinone oxidoreductase subunit M